MKAIKFLLAFFIMASFAMSALSAEAHNGQTAKDGCHNQKSTGTVHFHKPGTKERMGECIKHSGKRWQVPDAITGNFTREVFVEKEVIVRLDPTEEMLEQVRDAEAEASNSRRDRNEALQLMHEARDQADIAIQQSGQSRARADRYERRMQAMERGDPPCLHVRAELRAEIRADRSWGAKGRFSAIGNRLLDCFAIGE